MTLVCNLLFCKYVQYYNDYINDIIVTLIYMIYYIMTARNCQATDMIIIVFAASYKTVQLATTYTLSKSFAMIFHSIKERKLLIMGICTTVDLDTGA